MHYSVLHRVISLYAPILADVNPSQLPLKLRKTATIMLRGDLPSLLIDCQLSAGWRR